MAIFLVLIFAASAHAGGLLPILSAELQRNFAVLQHKADPAPYYLAYSVTEEESEVIAASSGALLSHNRNHARFLDITVRVGSPKLDNYHSLRGGERARFTSGANLPLDDVPAAIRQRVWIETDRSYRAAAQRYIQIQNAEQTRVAPEDQSGDFSSEPPSIADQPVPVPSYSSEEWVTRLRAWSAELAHHPGVLNSNVAFLVQRENKYLVSSEGTQLHHGRTFARIVLLARGKAADGMDLAATDSFEAELPERLPQPVAVLAAAKRVGGDLEQLLHAPSVEPFAGPAILSGRASGVFFHEIFGHRVEGHRQKDESEGQTFTRSIGQAVLPPFLSITFDPARRSAGNIDLNGSYAFDDEGVPARPVRVVENGVLKTFLMSRSPVKGFERSNAHGRKQAGAEVVSRQSNLIVESKNQVSDKELRDMLLAEVRRQSKPYGLYFRDVTGGYTLTQRRGLQAFTVVPLIVYRVYPDGRPDELVRGADIVGTPLSSFSRILAASNKLEVFNGYCGAESGTVPVSAVSPAILVSEIEIQKKEHGQSRPPYLPAPGAGGGE